MDISQLRRYVVKPALTHINNYSLNAEQLVMATAMAESKVHYIQQVGRGPARGLFQMEPATHNDIWANYLSGKPRLVGDLTGLTMRNMDLLEQLRGNLFYAAAMCRIFYLRFREPLPEAGDWDGMARYWKKYYNTHLGAGTERGFLQKTEPLLKLYPRRIT